jgi:hypothetical protein
MVSHGAENLRRELAQCACPDFSDTNFGLISGNGLVVWLPERSAPVAGCFHSRSFCCAQNLSFRQFGGASETLGQSGLSSNRILRALKLVRQELTNFLTSEEKRQAHNLKVVGSNPTPATTLNAANVGFIFS